MISIDWLFYGFLTGMIIAVVFRPPVRKIPKTPTPETGNEAFYTDSGCVKFHATQVKCDNTELSLNALSNMYNK
jgi:hypothetical protein